MTSKDTEYILKNARNTACNALYMWIAAATMTIIIYILTGIFNPTFNVDLIVLGSFFFFCVFLQLLAVRGLKQQKKWGRLLSIVLGFLMLFVFPFGTIMGGIILWQMLRDEWFS